MADTKLHQGPHHASIDPVEGDGISYSGIVWFVVILVVTTVVCQVLMVVLFKALDYQQKQADATTSMPAPLAAPAGNRQAVAGQVYPDMVAIGRPNGPEPRLLVREPVNLETLRAHEHETLTTYGWADKNAGTFRIPIDRAKDLIIERGLPTRGTDAGKTGAAKDVKEVKEVKK